MVYFQKFEIAYNPVQFCARSFFHGLDGSDILRVRVVTYQTVQQYSSTVAAGHTVIVPSVQQVKLHIRTVYPTVEQDGFWPAVFVK